MTSPNSQVTDTSRTITQHESLAADRVHAVLDEVERAVVGKREALELIVSGVLAGGHVLLEDLPGVGKTLIARSFAQVMGLSFKRIQFTPDLMPADLTGTEVFNQASAEFTFRPGPIFTNVLLADEINRTPPKTQSALLEAMAEHQVTIDGESRTLPHPFLVLATENPVEYEGTYPLPEALLDRFVLRVRIGYLAEESEVWMLQRRLERGAAPAHLRQVLEPGELARLQTLVDAVTVHPDVLTYAVRLAAGTRSHRQLLIGAGPRAVIDLVQLARARAAIRGRDFVLRSAASCFAVFLASTVPVTPPWWAAFVAAGGMVAVVVLVAGPLLQTPERDAHGGQGRS